MSEKLASTGRWLFLASFIYAPWAYGCTRPWTIDVLNGLLAVCCLVRVLAWALGQRGAIPWGCLALIGGLVAQGWWMVGNAHGLYDPEFHAFIPLQSWIQAGPGAIDRATSAPAMVRVSALLAAFCLAVDLGREETWRRRLPWVILAAGASVISFGLVERILRAPGIFWEEGSDGHNFFGTYVYHGNAGSFINLVLPMVAVLTCNAFRPSGSPLKRAICVPALLVTIAGAFVNVSKAAMLISVGLLVALMLWQAPQIIHAWSEGARARVLAGAGAILLALAVLVAAGGWQMARDRWAELPKLLNDNPRTLATQITRTMTHDSGWWGFGPGAFETAFPHYSNPAGERIQGIWRYAHQDYWQTVVEWGWIGAAEWALLLFGGLGLAGYSYLKRGGTFDWQTKSLHLAAALGLSATALHSTVDFPFQIASLQLYIVAYAGIGWSSLVMPAAASARRRHLRSHTRPRSSNSNLPRSPSAGD